MKCVLRFLVLFLALSGCSRDASSEGEFVTARFSIALPSDVPSSMLRAFLYDCGGGELIGQFFISGTAGDTIFTTEQSLRSGTYDMVAYNFDMSDTFVRGESSILTVEAYTDYVEAGISAVFKSFSDESFELVHTPDPMAVAVLRGISVEEGALIRGNAVRVTRSDDVRIPADGLSFSRSASAAVSGFASTYFLGRERTGGDDNIYFDLHPYTVKENAGYLMASVNSFGMISDTHDFQIYVVSGGESAVYQATTGDDFVFPGKIEIKEPEDGDAGGGSGFTPKVGAWNDLDINVPIGL